MRFAWRNRKHLRGIGPWPTYLVCRAASAFHRDRLRPLRQSVQDISLNINGDWLIRHWAASEADSNVPLLFLSLSCFVVLQIQRSSSQKTPFVVRIRLYFITVNKLNLWDWTGLPKPLYRQTDPTCSSSDALFVAIDWRRARSAIKPAICWAFSLSFCWAEAFVRGGVRSGSCKFRAVLPERHRSYSSLVNKLTFMWDWSGWPPNHNTDSDRP